MDLDQVSVASDTEIPTREVVGKSLANEPMYIRFYLFADAIGNRLQRHDVDIHDVSAAETASVSR